MNVFVYDPFISSEKIESLGGKKVQDLKDAVRTMDAISLHIPLNEETKDMINLDLLKTMKKNCIVINAARGGIINEKDLDQALNENIILDLFEIIRAKGMKLHAIVTHLFYKTRQSFTK